MNVYRNECIALYNRYLHLDNNDDYSHDELSKIVIGCFAKNNKELENLDNENVLFEILDIMCMKLLTIPKFSLHIRMSMENLESIKEIISEKKVRFDVVLMIFLTKEEITACIY
jgi:hypothetical protein